MDTEPANTLNCLDILVIDDDTVARKSVKRALEDDAELSLRFASNGEDGLKQAFDKSPDIILLDIEMPGINGYQVCEQLREDALTLDIPVIFLSSLSDLRSRMQCYEVGGNDFILKPFETGDLKAKIKVLARYSENKKELRLQYDIAQKTAYTAMTATSELGHVMSFVEKSYELRSIEEVATSLFSVTDRLNINCAIVISSGEDLHWYSSDGSISPIEKELVTMSDKNNRFVDFGENTIVHFSDVSLLARNMPLEDMERYGRLKDLFPAILSVVNAKAHSLSTEHIFEEQNAQLRESISQMKNDFYRFAKNVVDSRKQSEMLLANKINTLTLDFMKLGLEEDQERFIIDSIEATVDETLNETDSSEHLYFTLKSVLDNIQQIIDHQETLVHTFEEMRKVRQEAEIDPSDDGIELF